MLVGRRSTKLIIGVPIEAETQGIESTIGTKHKATSLAGIICTR